MDDKLFENQMRRLANRFGKQAFSKETQERICELCEGMTDKWLAQTVDHFLDTKRSAPLPREFSELAIEERRRHEAEVEANRQLLREQNKTKTCPHCDPNVPGMAWSDTIPREVGRCICGDGEKYASWMPKAHWLRDRYQKPERR